MCPHTATTIYAVCVLILLLLCMLYMCPHTATTIHAVCVLILLLLYMLYVSSYCYYYICCMCPHTATTIHAIYVSSYYYPIYAVCVLILLLLYMLYMCPHATISATGEIRALNNADKKGDKRSACQHVSITPRYSYKYIYIYIHTYIHTYIYNPDQEGRQEVSMSSCQHYSARYSAALISI